MKYKYNATTVFHECYVNAIRNIEWNGKILKKGMISLGDILDQYASDAWDVISGRKKIIGNKIVSCKNNELKEIINQDFG